MFREKNAFFSHAVSLIAVIEEFVNVRVHKTESRGNVIILTVT